MYLLELTAKIEEHSLNKRIATRGTEFSKTVNNNGRNLFVDVYSSEFHNGNSLFWLRSPGGTQIYI